MTLNTPCKSTETGLSGFDLGFHFQPASRASEVVTLLALPAIDWPDFSPKSTSGTIGVTRGVWVGAPPTEKGTWGLMFVKSGGNFPNRGNF